MGVELSTGDSFRTSLGRLAEGGVRQRGAISGVGSGAANLRLLRYAAKRSRIFGDVASTTTSLVPQQLA